MRKLLLLLISILSLHSYTNAQNATLLGTIQTINDEDVGGVAVTIYDASDNLISSTTVSGNFSFGGLTEGETYTLVFEKDVDPVNGVSTLDLVLTTKHILALQEFDSSYKIMAADVNDSQTVTTFDLIVARKLILAINESLPSPSWRFLLADLPFSLNPFGPTYNEVEVTISGQTETIEITGFKMGDVNVSAVAN